MLRRRRRADAAAALLWLPVLSLPAVSRGWACPPAFASSTCAALGDLYLSTAGPSWLANGGWAAAAALVGPVDVAAPHPCTFHGVTCDSTGARVVNMCASPRGAECPR